MTEDGKKSKAFQKFEAYFFGEDDLSLPMSHVLDIWTIDGLDDEEKLVAEQMVIAALSKKYDRRWIYALEELATENAYQFLWEWFNREEVEYTKVKIAYALVRIKGDAPVLEYLQTVLESDAPKASKLDALNCFYWILKAGLKDKERQQLFFSILFDKLTDKNKTIRLHVYELLKEFYSMKEFTPLDDEVEHILSKKVKKSEYERAGEIFENRVKSMEVVPIERKLIVQHIKSLPGNPPILEISDCKICSTIPDKAEADMTEDESLDKYKSKLEKVIIFAYYSNCIMRCPICGQLYTYRYHYEYLIGWSSEEDEYLNRTDTRGAIEMVDGFINSYDFKSIIQCGIFLKTIY